MDFVVSLPLVNDYDSVCVSVNWLTKERHLTAYHSTITSEGYSISTLIPTGAKIEDQSTINTPWQKTTSELASDGAAELGGRMGAPDPGRAIRGSPQPRVPGHQRGAHQGRHYFWREPV